MNFQWDRIKDAANQRKHKVGFREALSIFYDPLSTTFLDPDHSAEEQRFLTIGMSSNRRILVVSHIDKDETVRIISARGVTRSEHKFYEESK